MRLAQRPEIRWLGLVPYEEVHKQMLLRRSAIIAGEADEVIWLLEHQSVITTGRRAVEGLVGLDIEVVHTQRGGLATWHGPGQLVAYPILNLQARRIKVRDYVLAMERGLIAWLKGVGISAHPSSMGRGVFVGEKKIASIGIHLNHGISIHGFSLNLNCDLSPFSLITPCGISGIEMTSVAQELGVVFEPESVSEQVIEKVWQVIVATAFEGY